MINLLKYELIRKMKMYIIFISIILVLIALAAIGFNNIDNSYWIAVTVISSLVVLVGAGLFPIVINVANYYSDFKNRNGYMMFMTPNSGYKIFGSKILAAVIDTILSLTLISLFLLVIYWVLNSLYPQNVLRILEESKYALSVEFPGVTISGIIALTAGVAFVQTLDSIILALLAVTVSKTILSQKSFNWFVPFLIFIVFSGIEQTAMALLIGATNFSDIALMVAQEKFMLNISLVLGTSLGLYVVFTAAYTVVASMLLNKKIDL